MIDLHIHTNFSHDSYEKMESYIKPGMKAFVTTEHADFEDPKYGYDITFQLKKFLETVTVLKHNHSDMKIYKGIEIGFSRKGFDKINKFIKDGGFEIIILSFHANEEVNYMSAPKEYHISEDKYLEDVIWGINNFENIDIIGHLDYTFRRREESEYFFTNPLLFEAFDLMKEKKIALEVNTGSMYGYSNYDFYVKLLEVYRKNGNTLVALGSDAHVTNDYAYKFEEVLPLLEGLEIINYRYE